MVVSGASKPAQVVADTIRPVSTPVEMNTTSARKLVRQISCQNKNQFLTGTLGRGIRSNVPTAFLLQGIIAMRTKMIRWLVILTALALCWPRPWSQAQKQASPAEYDYYALAITSI